MAFTTAQKLQELSVATPLAVELGRQIDNTSYNWKRLMWSGMAAPLAKYVADTLPAGTFNVSKASEYGMIPKVSEFLFRSGGVLNAFSSFKQKIALGASDAVVTAVGDSLGNAAQEYLYKWFAYVSAQYPTHTFEYYPSDDNGGYGSVQIISTGSGSRKVKFYNNSVAGQTPSYLMGDKFPTAFATIPDVVIWGHGKNISDPANWQRPMTQGMIAAALAQVQVAAPNARHVAILECPNRDDTNMAMPIAAWQDIATVFPELLLVDCYNQVWLPGDYDDNLHPNLTTGTDKMLAPLVTAWNNSKAGVYATGAPFLSVSAASLLFGDSAERYGDFSIANGGIVPAGFTNVGTNVYSDETAIVYQANPRSTKMQGSGATAPRMTRSLTASQLAIAKSGPFMLTTAQYVPVGINADAGNVGRIAITYNGTGGTTISSRASQNARGGWRIASLGPFSLPSDTTTVTISLYHDSITPPDTDPVYYQWATVNTGKLPRALPA